VGWRCGSAAVASSEPRAGGRRWAEPKGCLSGRRRAGDGRAELKTGVGSRGRLKTGGAEDWRREVEDGRSVTRSPYRAKGSY
jgi:hypothetical protein